MDLAQTYAQIFDNLFQELGLASLDPEAKERLAKRMHESLEKAVIVRITAALPDNVSEEEYRAMDEDDVTKLLAENNIDPIQIAMQEAALMQDELKQVISYSQGYLEGLKKRADDDGEA